MVFVTVMFVISKHPGRVVWRHVFWGIGLQYLFGFLILRFAICCFISIKMVNPMIHESCS